VFRLLLLWLTETCAGEGPGTLGYPRRPEYRHGQPKARRSRWGHHHSASSRPL